MTSSVILQAAALLLCAPFSKTNIGRWLYDLTDAAYLGNYLAHILFLASVCAVIAAVAWRCVPRDQINTVMHHVELPTGYAALLMLLTYTLSHSVDETIQQFDTTPQAQFFALHQDIWLRSYWMIFGLICAYQLAYLLKLLLAVRRQPRSRTSAHLYIAGIAVGAFAIPPMEIHGLLGITISQLWLWIPCCGGLTIALTASGLSAKLQQRRIVVHNEQLFPKKEGA